MAKPAMSNARFGFRGGLNTAMNPDELQTNELVRCDDARVDAKLGAITKRTGTRRIHATAIGSGNAVTGVFQWLNQAGSLEVVAVANGRFYHKTSAFGDFTEVIPSPLFSTTVPQRFALFREAVVAAALRLYIADGTVVYRWDGTTLTQVDGTTSFPNAELIVPYHTRLAANDPDLEKNIFLSKVGDAEDFVPGGPADGISAIVDILSGESITALEVIGSSLLVCTEDSIMRITGYSTEDIQVEQDTEGIASQVGVVGRNAIDRAESIAAILSDRGPYLVSEAGITPIGLKVEPEFDNLDLDNISTASVAHHRSRRSIWYAVPGTADGGQPKRVYEYSLRLSAWQGPFIYPFEIRTMARFEDTNGQETLIAGNQDGFVRLLDTGSKDDVLSDGTGGSTYDPNVELAPMFFDNGPGIVTLMRRVFLQADLPSSIKLGIAFDDLSFTDFTISSGLPGILNHRQEVRNRGGRMRLRLQDGGVDNIWIVAGFQFECTNMQRITPSPGASVQVTGISETSSGLLFRDPFNNRGDSNTVGNGWIENEENPTDIQIETGRGLVNNAGLGDTDLIVQVPSGTTLPAEFGIQLNMRVFQAASDSNQIFVGAAGASASTVATDGYLSVIRAQANDLKLFRLNSSTPTQLGSTVTGLALSIGDDIAWRITARQNGSNYDVRTSLADPLSGRFDVTVDFVSQILAINDPPPTFGNQIIQLCATGAQQFGEYMYYGGASLDVTMTNVPVGHTVQIDSLPAVAPIGGTASINIDLKALPRTTIKVLDPLSVVIASLSPAVGIFPGGVYNVDTA